MSDDFIFRGSIHQLDPQLKQLLDREKQRQEETIILIPSESIAADAVNEALGSAFGNIYAEGYPREESRRQSEQEILDFDAELAYYRRYSDPRYYKGVEYADVLEALARRRAAELFAANGVRPGELYVNVQPLSGAPANSAIYSALLQPGDTIMGLNLNDGGHLSHGASVNRSGKIYNSVPYFVDEATEQLNYDAIEQQVLDVQPNVIVAGYSAYPRIVDWRRFRHMADQVGAYLLADISHISGLVASGEHPSPIGIADVVMTTTHKSLCGPRGAMIITHRSDLYRKLDRAVFPGEQGGPHLNTMAALATALRLANSDQFRALQARISQNARRLSEQLEAHGIRTVSGISETHLLVIDAKSIHSDDAYLTGDMAARILDLAGIVTNRNTIPGDGSAFAATGVRMGTVWISQLGFDIAEIDRLADAISIVLHGCTPYNYIGRGGRIRRRAKVAWEALEEARAIVRDLRGVTREQPAGKTVALRGQRLTEFLDLALSSDVLALQDGQQQGGQLRIPGRQLDVQLKRIDFHNYQLRFRSRDKAQLGAVYLQDLSDGFIQFGDLHAKLPGPVTVTMLEETTDVSLPEGDDRVAGTKPYFICSGDVPSAPPLPSFAWSEDADAPIQRTSLWQIHREMGAKMVPFGGWDMPVWYTSVSDEHAAVRETAGLFDVTHMGVLEASGPYAATFLETVTTNEIATLKVGQSHYTYLLFPDGSVVDDLLIYRRADDVFMLVVNAANNDKDWAWLQAVNDGQVQIDAKRPGARIQHPCRLRDLRDPQWGQDCRVDIALQGPASKDLLLQLCQDEALANRIGRLRWAELTEGMLGEFDTVISRTGYTGERVAYELFVHPDQAPAFWQALLAAGKDLGVKPCGLAARDSTRTEAGLPLYGHELSGPLELTPGDAGFASYVKFWKPFFVGRTAMLASESKRERLLVRFRMDDKAVRRPELGDPVLDRRGKVIGTVTSCAIDRDGYLLGQAVVPLDMTAAGTSLYVYQLGGGSRSLRMPKSVAPGARLPKPDTATVLTRFPSGR